MITYYTLIPAHAHVGQTLLNDPYVTYHPSLLPISQFASEPGPSAADVILQRTLRLAQVTPEGVGINDGIFSSADAWTISKLEPINELLGPDAEHIIAAYKRKVAAMGEDGTSDGPTARAYHDAIERQYEADAPAIERHFAAARNALDSAQIDGGWWESCGGYAGSAELLALAARCQVGWKANWTWEAYDALTMPYRQAFGLSAHPVDEPLVAAPSW